MKINFNLVIPSEAAPVFEKALGYLPPSAVHSVGGRTVFQIRDADGNLQKECFVIFTYESTSIEVRETIAYLEAILGRT